MLYMIVSSHQFYSELNYSYLDFGIKFTRASNPSNDQPHSQINTVGLLLFSLLLLLLLLLQVSFILLFEFYIFFWFLVKRSFVSSDEISSLSKCSAPYSLQLGNFSSFYVRFGLIRPLRVFRPMSPSFHRPPLSFRVFRGPQSQKSQSIPMKQSKSDLGNYLTTESFQISGSLLSFPIPMTQNKSDLGNYSTTESFQVSESLLSF